MTPREARALWAAELESGNWKQGTGQLARQTDTGTEYCCLGVACELAVLKGIIEGYEGETSDLAPYTPVMNWLGLRSRIGAYRRPGASHGSLSDALAKQNDSGQSFKQIAAIIRNEPEGLIA
jgi:hypothetical protein